MHSSPVRALPPLPLRRWPAKRCSTGSGPAAGPLKKVNLPLFSALDLFYFLFSFAIEPENPSRMRV